MPFGAEVLVRRCALPGVGAVSGEDGTFAGRTEGVQKSLPMAAPGDGWFESQTVVQRSGSRYRFVLENGLHIPDPASRFNPADVHGASMVVDPAAFEWQDGDWKGTPVGSTR